MTHPLSSSTIIDFLNHFNDSIKEEKPSNYWSNYLKTGSYLWLDTGDIDAARKIWSSDFSALTTNNTLLNQEIQKGVYDKIIPLIASKISSLPESEQVREIAFCLNV
ncbi:MAG: transaldolase, partial [Marinilabiliaceae bacterium]|nr:transaldolase [Marinilabiliaceae bacterium]